jgi:nickel/cobalt transporter (NiCoT) family protein
MGTQARGAAYFESSPQGRTALLYVLLIGANVAAWVWAWRAFAGQPALLGTALLAWVFGLRHAVDADHIAAIDNVVRKLMQEGRRPIAVGFFFSLGHSTVVVLASLTIAATTAAMQDRLEAFKVIGTSVSAAFLLLIALANLVILRGVWRSFRHVAHGGTLDTAASPVVLLAGGGLQARLCRPLFRSVTRSWHMYPLGFLFGLGFDTATEVGLLGIAAAQAQGMSPWQTLVFPALFTAGMALVDTTDSALMVGAYGWAFVQPLRKLWYNLTITAASVLIALLIGGVEALGLLVDQLGLEGGLWSAVSFLNDDLTNFGFAVVGIFLLAWGVSAIVYRWKGYDRLMPTVASTE